MQGRDGPEGNPEVMIGSFSALIAILFGGFICPLINMFRKNKIILGIIGLITIVFLILAATPVGFPYGEKVHPQRYYALVRILIIIIIYKKILINLNVFSTPQERSIMLIFQ